MVEQTAFSSQECATSGTSGETVVSGSTASVASTGQTEYSSSTTKHNEKDPQNSYDFHTGQTGNGTFCVTGNRTDNHFADGTTSSQSTYSHGESGTYNSSETTATNYDVSKQPLPGVTEAGSGASNASQNCNNVTYQDQYQLVTNDPVDGPLTSIQTASHTESGDVVWNNTNSSNSSKSGTVTDPASPGNQATVGQTSNSNSTYCGTSSFSSSDSRTTTKTGSGIGMTTQVSSNHSDSSAGMSLTTTNRGSSGTNSWSGSNGSTTRSTQSTDSSFVVETFDNTNTLQVNANGERQTYNSNDSGMTGFSNHSSGVAETNSMSQPNGASSSSTTIDTATSASMFNVSFAHGVDHAADGTETHSGSGGSSSSAGFSHSTHDYNSSSSQQQWSMSAAATNVLANGLLTGIWQFLTGNVNGSSYTSSSTTNTRKETNQTIYGGSIGVTFDQNGQETWSGSNTESWHKTQDYTHSESSVSNVCGSQTDRDNDGVLENHTSMKNHTTTATHKETRAGKTKDVVQSDGSTTEEDLMASNHGSDLAVHIESRNTDTTANVSN